MQNPYVQKNTANRVLTTNCIEEKKTSTERNTPGDTHTESYTIYSIQYKRIKPIKVTLHLNQIPVDMELDTGASLSIINYSTFNKLQKNDKRLSLKPTQVKVRTYTGEMIAVMGLVEVNVEYNAKSFKQPVFVVSGDVC